jgi:hypothetical protein
MATPKKKPVKKRSDQGRNESKRGKVAGKGFVVAKTTKNERKAQGKALGKMAGAAAPGGLAVKGAIAGAKAVAAKKAAKAASKSKVPKLAPGQKMPPAPNYGQQSPYQKAKIAAEKKKAAEDAAQKAKEKARALSDKAKKGKAEYEKRQIREAAERDKYGPYGKGPHWNYGGYLT